MSACKPYVLSFLMGGFYCFIGQIFLTIWSPILGPAFGMPATLLSMGVVGVILYITGIHQKLAPHTGWGSILVFNGFACALATEYEEGAKEGGAGKGALGGFAGAGTGILVIGFGEAVYMAIQQLLGGDWTGVLTNFVVLLVFCLMGVIAGAGHLARTKNRKDD